MDQSYSNGYYPQITAQGVYLCICPPLNLSATHLVLTSNGSLVIEYWDEDLYQWTSYWQAPSRRCDVYGLCGPFGVCTETDSPICRCLRGFVPKSEEEWGKGDWTAGCVRQRELSCEKNYSKSSNSSKRKDGFLKMGGMKLPDSSEYLSSPSGIQDCESWCVSNCSCVAYAFVNGIQCMIWATDLMDIQQFLTNISFAGEDLFIRLPYSELGGRRQADRIIISLIVACSFIFLCIAICWCRRKAKRRGQEKDLMNNTDLAGTSDSSRNPVAENVRRNHQKEKVPSELPTFDIDTILVATDNFSIANKLGQGGFGPVYKGKLLDGKEIAVKRLSNSSGQGIEEFKNEILLISKFQHRNLVRLLGFCIKGEEKLLVYEYMPNRSLDKFLFDSIKGAQLGWAKRFYIIQGIARGLLYLHRDSCLRVIHRDLKVSNILLDADMNPKISDFGLARTFRETEDLGNTLRVVGTFGYMSPEYVMRGIFSEKSDVFSFGVLLLEIVSGRRNTSFNYHDQHLNLLGYAWQLWSENRGLELMDKALVDSFSPLEVMRCIHVALLCVQDHASDRPTMSTVVFMLSNDTDRPQPKHPMFPSQSSLAYDLQSKWENICSLNAVSVSIIEGR